MEPHQIIALIKARFPGFNELRYCIKWRRGIRVVTLSANVRIAGRIYRLHISGSKKCWFARFAPRIAGVLFMATAEEALNWLAREVYNGRVHQVALEQLALALAHARSGGAS